MYKFEIYKNTYDPMISTSYNDNIRYAEELYVFERTIYPLWNDLAFKWVRDDGRFFFRKILDGEFSLINTDFDWANEIRQNNSEKNFYRILKISEKVNGSWGVVWKGFFSVINGTFDLGKCSSKFSEILVFDEYSVILENIEKEINLIDLPTYNVNYEIHTYDFDVDVSSSVNYFTACSSVIPTFLEPLVTEFYPDELEKWTLVRKQTNYGGQEYHDGVYSWVYNITLVYRRDVTYAAAPPGAEWVLIDNTGALNKYARHYKDMDALTFSTILYDKMYYVPVSGVNCKFTYSDNNVVLPSDLEYENERARLFTTVVYHLINQTSSITTYESTFFEAVTNPITGNTNTLNLLMLFQISDMKPTSDPATRGMYLFKDLENWLEMFQCGWYIDEYGSLRIEHRKYFDLGLSYTENQSDMIISKVGLEVDYSSDTPQIETIKFGYSNGQDFIGEPIIYHGNIVNRTEDSGKRDYSFSNISTDLTYVTSNEDEIGNDGFFMVSTVITNNGELWVYKINGDITGELIWNGYLSTANLMNDYWKWWRSTSSGIMNNVRTEFTAKNIIIHSDIIIPSCDSFNPYKLKTTDIGDGVVEEALLTLKDKKLTLTLSY